MNHVTDPIPNDASTWETIRSRILEAAQTVMGPLPSTDRTRPPGWNIQEETDCGGYRRLRIEYESEPGCLTSAYLCRPQAAAPESPAHAVLCLHPTNQIDGYADVVGLTDRENRSYASELAERGFVTIAPSYPHMAEYQPDLDALGYVSGTMKAIWDNIRALDLLDSLDFVKGGAFATIGHSLGGHNSVYTATFDTRLVAVVSNCGLDSYLDYKDGDISRWGQTKYMPRILSYPTLNDIPFDFHDLISSIAPRACLISAPIHDNNIKWKSAASVVEAARHIYQFYGAENRLKIIHPPCAHDFPAHVRTQAYNFIGAALS